MTSLKFLEETETEIICVCSHLTAFSALFVPDGNQCGVCICFFLFFVFLIYLDILNLFSLIFILRDGSLTHFISSLRFS